MKAYITMDIIELREVETGFAEQVGYSQFNKRYSGERFEFRDLNRLSLFWDCLYENKITYPEIKFHHYSEE